MVGSRGKTMKRTTRKRTMKKVAIPTRSRVSGTAVSQIVRAFMNKNADTKYRSSPLTGFGFTTTLASFTSFNGNISGTGELYSLIPPIPQSSTGSSSTRIGDTITPTKLKVSLTFGLPYQNFSSDLLVHVFFLTSKAVKYAGNYTAVPILQLLDKGDGTTQGFRGDLLSSQYPVNTKAFTVLSHKVIRITKPGGLNNRYYQAGSNADEMVYPKDSIKYLNKTFKLPKLKYAEDQDTYPQNQFPFVCIGYTYADSVNDASDAPAQAQPNLKVQGQSQLWFKDF